MLAVAPAACAPHSEGRLHPVPWQAFYVPSVAAMVVFDPSASCAATFTISESNTRILISAKDRTQTSGSTCRPNGLRLLSHPVSQRPILAASSSSPGVAYSLLDRLHPPITSPHDLPYLASYVHGTLETIYHQQSVTPWVLNLLSAPLPTAQHYTPTALRVRRTHAVTPCGQSLCWIEGSVLYSLNYFKLDAHGGTSGPTTPVGTEVNMADELRMQ